MANVRVKLNQRGVREVLKSSPVQADISARAARAARAGGPGIEAVTKPHRYTSRAFVQTADAEGRKRQAESAVLERALDAAR